MRRLYYKGENLYIKGEKKNNVFILYLEGELDAHGCPPLERIIEDIVDTGIIRFIVDCSKLQYICSTAVGLFISHMGNLKERGGKLIFLNVSDNIEMVFSLLNIKEMFVFSDKTIEEAVKLFDNE